MAPVQAAAPAPARASARAGTPPPRKIPLAASENSPNTAAKAEPPAAQKPAVWAAASEDLPSKGRLFKAAFLLGVLFLLVGVGVAATFAEWEDVTAGFNAARLVGVRAFEAVRGAARANPGVAAAASAAALVASVGLYLRKLVLSLAAAAARNLHAAVAWPLRLHGKKE